MPKRALVLVCLALAGATNPALALTRSQVIARAQTWVDAKVPYSQSQWFSNSCGSYRQDCSGYVSMAWALPTSAVTWTLPNYSTQLGSFNDLKPGDAVDHTCCHVFLFKEWIQPGVSFKAYEESDYGTVAHISTKQVSSCISQGYKPYRLNGIQEDPPPNKPPDGWLDGASASCVLQGWAQDPDTPQNALDIHIYLDGPAGAAGALGVNGIKANVNRADLCSAIGSCNHGFEWPVPNAYRDGKPHSAYAYTFDSKSSAPEMLKGCPKSFTCAPPQPSLAPGQGVKRHVVDTACMTSWKLEARDVAPLSASVVASYPDGPQLPAKPAVVQADDGSPEVWVLDGKLRRHVATPASLAAWKLGPVEKRPAAEVATYAKGRTWPATPFLFRAEVAPEVYVLDEAEAPPPAPPAPAPSPGADAGGETPPGSDAGPGIAPEPPPAGSDAGAAAAAGESTIGGGCSVAAGDTRPATLLPLVVLLLIVIRRRR